MGRILHSRRARPGAIAQADESGGRGRWARARTRPTQRSRATATPIMKSQHHDLTKACAATRAPVSTQSPRRAGARVLRLSSRSTSGLWAAGRRNGPCLHAGAAAALNVHAAAVGVGCCKSYPAGRVSRTDRGGFAAAEKGGGGPLGFPRAGGAGDAHDAAAVLDPAALLLVRVPLVVVLVVAALDVADEQLCEAPRGRLSAASTCRRRRPREAGPECAGRSSAAGSHRSAAGLPVQLPGSTQGASQD